MMYVCVLMSACVHAYERLYKHESIDLSCRALFTKLYSTYFSTIFYCSFSKETKCEIKGDTTEQLLSFDEVKNWNIAIQYRL